MSDTVYLRVLYSIWDAVKDTRKDATRPTIRALMAPVKKEMEAMDKEEEEKREKARVNR